MIDAVNVKVSTEDYTKLPEGSAHVHQAWSGEHGRGAVLPPEGNRRGGARVLVPRGRGRPDRQRHDGGAQGGRRTPCSHTS